MFLHFPSPSSWYLSGSHRTWRVTNITFLEPTHATIHCYTCIVYICMYLWMHMYLIWSVFVIWRDAESLVLTRALWISIVPYLIMEISKMCLFVRAVVVFLFLMQQSHHTWWQAMPGTSSSLWYRAAMFSLPSFPDFVGQIEASVNTATCTIRLSLTESRMFSASRNHSVPYEHKWKGVQAVNLLRFTFFA